MASHSNLNHGTAVHQVPSQATTAGRPTNAFPGHQCLDVDLHTYLYWDAERREWRPFGVSMGTLADRPQAGEVPAGTLRFNTTHKSLEVASGATWRTLPAS